MITLEHFINYNYSYLSLSLPRNNFDFLLIFRYIVCYVDLKFIKNY